MTLREVYRKLFPKNTKVVLAQGHDGDFVAHLYNAKGQCLASATGCATPLEAFDILCSKVSKK